MISPELVRQLGAIGYALLGGFVFVRSPVAALFCWTGAALMIPGVHAGLDERLSRSVDPWRLFAVASVLAGAGVVVWLVG